MNRRSLLTGLASLIVAPAIVRADSLMQLRGDIYHLWEWHCPILPPMLPGMTRADLDNHLLGPNGRLYRGTWTFFGKDRNIYSDKEVAFRKEEYES